MNSVERMRIAAVQKRVNASFEHGCGDCDCDLCFLLAVLSRTTQPGQAESTASMQEACKISQSVTLAKMLLEGFSIAYCEDEKSCFGSGARPGSKVFVFKISSTSL